MKWTFLKSEFLNTGSDLLKGFMEYLEWKERQLKPCSEREI